MRNAFKSLMLTGFLLLAGFVAFAQVTTSSLSGRVTEEAGPVVGATVVAVHQPTGSQFYAVTDAKGYYRLNNITSGGPYKVTVACMGYSDVVFTDVYVALSDNLVLDAALAEESLTLEGVVVSAEGRTSNMRSDRAGAITSLSSKEIMEVPSISRSMNDLLKQTPQAYVSGTKVSIGGGNYRQSYVTVDGAAFNNAFGIGSNLPGNGSPISLDALDQVAISVTPYDVRQSGFVGGGIAATTKSGTNEFSGTAYLFFRNQDMQGTDVADQTLTLDKSRYLMYGASVGGPIVKDKLFFFLNAEFDKSIMPGPSRRLSNMIDDGTGTLVRDGNKEIFVNGKDGVARPSPVVLDAFSNYLSKTYGYDTGVYKGYSTEAPSFKILGRLDWNITRNHKFNVRYSYTESKSSPLMSSSFTGFADNNYAPSGNRTSMYAMYYQNSRYYQNNTFMSVAGELNSRFLDGKLNNSLRATYSHQYDPRQQDGGFFPGVDIVVGDAIYTTVGTEAYTYGNIRDVHTVLVSDELTLSAGIHNLLLGAQFEYNNTINGYQVFGGGGYVFKFADEQSFYSSILNKTVFNSPYQYAVTHGNNVALEQAYPHFKYEQASVYLQDQMNISERFRLTAGVRFELPYYPSMDFNANPNVAAATFAPTSTNPSGKYDTTQLPSSKLTVSPRVGFNWDVLGNRKLVLRGGTGIFVGRIPFVWIVAQAGNSNVMQTTITRKAPNDVIPTISADRNAMIQQLYPDGGYRPSINETISQLTLIDPALRNPQNWKSSLALDVELPGETIFSLEGVYSKEMYPVTVTNVGLRSPVSMMDVPDVYPRPYWKNGSYNDKMANVYVLRSVDNPALWGYYYSVTASLQKKLWRGFTGNISYTYTDARSVNDGVGDQVSSTWKAFVNQRGTNSIELGAPNYVMPHRVMANITWNKDYDKYFGTTVALYYYGGPRSRGSVDYYDNLYGDGAYAYTLIDIPTYQNLFGPNAWQFEAYSAKDENGNNFTYSAEQQKLDLWAYIQNNPYLREHTGEVAQRNGLVFPWVHQFDLKVKQNFYFYTGSKHHKHTIQLGLDVENVANLLNPYWGNVWSIAVSDGYGNAKPLNITNPAKVYTEGARPVFQFKRDGNSTLKDTFYRTISTASTWNMMFSVRYIF